ncbi:hypothetical protein ACGFI9_37295 [Micromonospora sp. NPDC048930]|uniref:hypothetical protein n=1 Tax=Micromonospora sp. NPDC048930 TaxID=3364261 RepID=UPI00371B6001
MTPHHHWAQSAAWSLDAALLALDARAVIEARAIRAQQEAAAEPLRSPSWGSRRALGGHGDPTGDALLTIGTARPNRYADLAADVQEQLHGVSHHLPGDSFNPLYRIREALPAFSPGTAHATWRLLDRLDGRVRRTRGLDIPSGRRHLVDVACPVCAGRALYVQTAGPESDWTVVCAGSWRDGRDNPCLCVGEGCPCGMDGAVEGVVHIWLRHVVLGAVAGAAPAGTK